MNRDEAQFVLRAYRLGSQDAEDPQFAAALALARRDPELARWLSEEQSIDAALARRIREAIPVPPNLKSQLLLLRATQRTVPAWRRPWLAIAASVAVALGTATAVWWRLAEQRADRERPLEAFRSSMAAAAADMANHMDVMGLTGDELRRWLVAHGGEAGYVLPPGLADKDIAACRIVEWQQRRVTMLCFKFNGTHADLFVVDASALPHLSATGPLLAASGGASTVTWQREGKVYLLIANRPLEELARLI